LAIEIGAASLSLVALYPFMKRITWWPQLWLGLTFNWGALVGFAAVTGRFDWADLMLYAGLVFWTLGYDTLYALQDKDDDALIGVKSTARLFGPRARDFIERFYVVSFALVLASGFADHAGWPFAFLMLVAGAHLLWQCHRLVIDSPEDCLRRFKSNRETGTLMAAAFIISSWVG
jgi:4-hydroxybenzoate polyprenyltransferase